VESGAFFGRIKQTFLSTSLHTYPEQENPCSSPHGSKTSAAAGDSKAFFRIADGKVENQTLKENQPFHT
jgi:hypothetical protein